MAGTAAIIAAAIGAAGAVAGGVANAAHGGPPSPLAGQPPGGAGGYRPTALSAPRPDAPGGANLRLSDILGQPQGQDEDQMTLRRLLQQQAP